MHIEAIHRHITGLTHRALAPQFVKTQLAKAHAAAAASGRGELSPGVQARTVPELLAGLIAHGPALLAWLSTTPCAVAVVAEAERG